MSNQRLEKSNLTHDYYAVNSVDGRKVVNQRINDNRLELTFMWAVVFGAVGFITYCALEYGNLI